MQLYRDPAYGIKVSYPYGWTANTTGLQEGTAVLFIPPKNATESDRLAGVRILVHPAYGNSLENISRWEASRHNAGQLGAGVTPTIENTTLSGFPAKEVSLTVGNSSNNPVQLLYFIAVQGSKEYALQFFAAPQAFHKYLSQIQYMAKSLQIDTSKIPDVSGHFNNPKLGMSFTLPQGWTGLQYAGRNNNNSSTHIVAFSHVDLFPVSNKTGYASVSIFSNDNSNLAQIRRSPDLCTPTQSSEIIFLANKTKALHYVTGCDFDGYRTFADTYQVISANRTAFMVFTANSNSSFSEYVPVFEKIAKTFSEAGAVNLSDFTKVPALYANYSSKPVTVSGKDYNVQLETTSAISDFQYGPQNNQISFKATEAGMRGFTILNAEKVIGQPYVTMDGREVGYTTIHDRTANLTYIQLNYASGSHDFVIKGR